jgi:hypothetical protein
MDLKTFVAETITQIIEGVKGAQEGAKQLGGHVNPLIAGPVAPELMKHKMFVATGGVAQFVEFDVAVTATEGSGSKGGVGIVVGAFTLGSTGESRGEHTASSRVRFAVPVTLPPE